jgi:hypothetical protein
MFRQKEVRSQSYQSLVGKESDAPNRETGVNTIDQERKPQNIWE